MDNDTKFELLTNITALITAHKQQSIHEHNIRSAKDEIARLKEEIETEERRVTQEQYYSRSVSKNLLAMAPDLGVSPFVAFDAMGNQFVISRGDYDVLYVAAVPAYTLNDVLDEVGQ
jgi:DNA gyrase/topoisomerase IV subunit A